MEFALFSSELFEPSKKDRVKLEETVDYRAKVDTEAVGY